MQSLRLLLTLFTTALAQEPTCPYSNQYGYAFPNAAPVPDPMDSSRVIVQGYISDESACESCSVTTQNTQLLPEDPTPGTYFHYDYDWNKEAAERSFWESTSKGWKQTVAWYESCPAGYESDRGTWSWSGECKIPNDDKFIGESCSDKSQCANDFVEDYVDMTCAPTNNDANDPQLKCVLDEDAKWLEEQSLQSTCSCFGFFYCNSDDCHGNLCVLSTYDNQKHCKYADDDTFTDIIFSTGQCSNCRKADKPCSTYDGSGRYTSTASITGLSLLFALIVFLFAVAFVGRKYYLQKQQSRLSLLDISKLPRSKIADSTADSTTIDTPHNASIAVQQEGIPPVAVEV